MKVLLVFAAATMLLVTSCHRHPTCGEGNPPTSGEYVFEIEYINHAWGVHHEGVVIDNQGRMYRYDNPAWAATQKEMPVIYSAADLKAKYGASLAFIKELTKSEVEGYFAQANAVTGTLGDPVTRCADAGSTSYIAYIYDNETQRYKRLTLMVRGDMRQTHSDARATSIAEWLRTLDKPYTDFPCTDQ